MPSIRISFSQSVNQVGENTHGQTLEQGGELGNQSSTQHDDAATSHKLLHALGLY